MERLIQEDEVIRWKKVGGGGFYFKNRIIKPGQVFTARVSEIPKAFRDVCIPLDEIKVVQPPPVDAVKAEYIVQPRGKSKTWFDVVDGRGKVINEKALLKDVAEKLAHDLLK